MKIAIASGKGGTGKTTVAINMAYAASRKGESVTYLDCDVDEPNAHIFLKPDVSAQCPVELMIPKIDMQKCTLCKECVKVCEYGAITCVADKVLVFSELCHSCGGCTLACPVNAITEEPKQVGLVETGRSGAIQFAHGILDIGEAKSPPVIAAVKEVYPKNGHVLIDAPPGTSCPVIESIRDCDYVLLVTEPTPFGLNDLRLAVEMVRALDLPFSVVINRADVGDDRVQRFCHENGIRILAEIPDDRDIAEAYSRGCIICQTLPKYETLFSNLFREITQNA